MAILKPNIVKKSLSAQIQRILGFFRFFDPFLIFIFVLYCTHIILWRNMFWTLLILKKQAK